MTKEKIIPRKKLEKIFIENFALIFRLALSLRSSAIQTRELAPITAKKLENMSDEEIGKIELLISRFSKLQDLLGSNIFRSIILLDKEEAKTMRDVINKMEKKYIIDNVDNWDIIRDIRNEITHQYVPKGTKAAKTLKKVFKYTPELLKILCNVHKYAKEEINIDMSEFDTKNLKINRAKKKEK